LFNFNNNTLITKNNCLGWINQERKIFINIENFNVRSKRFKMIFKKKKFPYFIHREKKIIVENHSCFFSTIIFDKKTFDFRVSTIIFKISTISRQKFFSLKNYFEEKYPRKTEWKNFGRIRLGMYSTGVTKQKKQNE